MVGACYAGAPGDGAEVVRSLKEFGSPIVDRLEPKPYVALQSMFDPLVPHGWHRYWKSVELPTLTDGAIDTLIDHTSRITSPRSYTILLQLGGALGRVPEDATAFSQRDAAHNVVINAVWTEDDPEGERHTAWARDFFDALVVADYDLASAERTVAAVGPDDRLIAAQVDASDPDSVAALVREHRATHVMNAIDPRFVMPIFE